jgi:signal transduction histidine kinase
VLSCVWVRGVNSALYTALGLTPAMIFGFFASPSASTAPFWTIAANRILGIILTWLVALVVWRISGLNRDRARTLAKLQELHDIEERTANAERVELSRWLHEGLAQELSMVGWGLDRLARQEHAAGEVRVEVRELRAVIDGSLRSVHRRAVELRELHVEAASLAVSVQGYIARFTGRTGLPVDLSGVECLMAVPMAHTVLCLNLVQEALTNVAKHAGASHVSIEFREEPRAVRITITDDGRGLGTSARLNPDSLGLLGLRERLTAINGVLTVSNVAPNGARVEAWIPTA